MDNAWRKILSKRTATNQRMRLAFADNADQDYLSSRQFSAFHGAVLSIHGQSPRQLTEIARLCGKAELDQVDIEGITPLGWAVSYGDAEAVKSLLELGSNPNQADIRLYSPLMRSLHESRMLVTPHRGWCGSRLKRQ